MDKIEKSVFQSLNKFKDDLLKNDIDVNNEESEDENPDNLIKELSKLNQPAKISGSESKDFDFIQNKSFFDEIFFKNSKLFKIGSKEHTDFWSFLSKYQNLIKKKSASLPSISQSSETNSFSPNLKLPLKYDKRWRLNFVYKPNKSDQSGAYDALGNKIKFECSQEKMKEFEFIIHLYLDFLQKEK
ncbi:unnamed protein product, partial [Brachionus calyciflorus]